MKVRTGIRKVGGKWHAFFSIGVQTFFVNADDGTKEEAQWMQERLKAAFDSMDEL